MTKLDTNPDELMTRVLGTHPESKRSRRRKVLIFTISAIVLIAVIIMTTSYFKKKGSQIEYLTSEIVQGDLTVSISATGNLAPVKKVEVGSEVSGQVIAVYVEENDRVTKGQVLAQIDLSKIKEQVAQSEANLSAAEAQLAEAQATVAEVKTKLTRYREVFELSGGKVPAKTELETAEADLQRALASEASAKANVDNAKAELGVNQTNLKKATITSTVDGVVLSREIEPGQTIQASFSTPTLFTIAENLTQMKLEVQIDEADVGDVQNGQMATFTVDAYPNRTYQAKVDRLCLGATTTSGIVSYKAVLSVNNDDLSLRPGMTANAEIITLKREKAILAPIAGFRWSPPVQVSTSQTSGTNGGLVDKLMPRPPRPDENKEKEAASVNSRESQQTIWILKNGQPEAVSVTVGASNGSQAEIVSGNVEPGMKVITGTATRNK